MYLPLYDAVSQLIEKEKITENSPPAETDATPEKSAEFSPLKNLRVLYRYEEPTMLELLETIAQIGGRGSRSRQVCRSRALNSERAKIRFARFRYCGARKSGFWLIERLRESLSEQNRADSGNRFDGLRPLGRPPENSRRQFPHVRRQANRTGPAARLNRRIRRQRKFDDLKLNGFWLIEKFKER